MFPKKETASLKASVADITRARYMAMEAGYRTKGVAHKRSVSHSPKTPPGPVSGTPVANPSPRPPVVIHLADDDAPEAAETPGQGQERVDGEEGGGILLRGTSRIAPLLRPLLVPTRGYPARLPRTSLDRCPPRGPGSEA